MRTLFFPWSDFIKDSTALPPLVITEDETIYYPFLIWCYLSKNFTGPFKYWYRITGHSCTWQPLDKEGRGPTKWRPRPRGAETPTYLMLRRSEKSRISKKPLKRARITFYCIFSYKFHNGFQKIDMRRPRLLPLLGARGLPWCSIKRHFDYF